MTFVGTTHNVHQTEAASAKEGIPRSDGLLRSQMIAATINRFDWDFDSCPPAEVELCFGYERSRDTPEEIKAAEEWRRSYPKWANSAHWVEQPPGATFDDYWQREHHPMFAWHLYHEFPLEPYLSISPDERGRRFKLIQEFGIEPVSTTEDGSGIHEAFSNLLAEFGELIGGGISHHGEEYQANGSTITCGTSTYAAFRFNWEYSDQSYLDAMKAWLKCNRNKSVEIIRTRAWDFRAQLNQLGAWRLLNKYAMTWKEAEDFTQQARVSHKPLYSGQPSWIRARTEADRFLGMFNR